MKQKVAVALLLLAASNPERFGLVSCRAEDAAPVSTQLPAGTWAVVGSRSISKADVEKKAKSLPAFIPEDKKLPLVFQGLIDEVILEDGVAREGVPVAAIPDADVDKIFAEYRETAKRMGVVDDTPDADLKAKIRRQLAFRKWIEKDATEDALKASFAKHELEFAGEVRATAILLELRGDDTTTFQRALQVLAKVKVDGSNIAQLARDHSDDPNAALDSGDLDFFSAGARAVPPEVTEACFTRGKKGLVPRPVRTGRGYYVVFVTDTRFTEPSSFEKVKDRVRDRFLIEHYLEVYKAWRAAEKIAVSTEAPRLPQMR